MTMPALRQEMLNPSDNLGKSQPSLQIGEEIRQVAPHPLAVPIHDREIRPDVRSQIDLIDHEQIGASNPWAAFTWNLVACRDVNHVDNLVRQFRAECRGQVVTAAFNKH